MKVLLHSRNNLNITIYRLVVSMSKTREHLRTFSEFDLLNRLVAYFPHDKPCEYSYSAVISFTSVYENDDMYLFRKHESYATTNENLCLQPFHCFFFLTIQSECHICTVYLGNFFYAAQKEEKYAK